MKNARNSVVRPIEALAVSLAFCVLVSDTSAQPANESLDTKPLDVCVQSLTNARQRIDALARRAQTCRGDSESAEGIQRERDGAVAALVLALRTRAGLLQGCGETTIEIRFGGSRPAVEVRGTAREPAAAIRRIDDAIRDLGLDRASVDLRPADACGRRLAGGYVVLTVEPGDQLWVKERPSVNEIERLPDVEACEDVGQILVEAKLAPLRFWARMSNGQLAQCFRQGSGNFTWIDFNSGEPALVIQRGVP